MTDDPKTILIIDDEKVILLGVSAIMRQAGFNVFTAANGADGLTCIKENHLDLIICDINMPPPNGFELRQILSEDEETAMIPFIFVTARSALSDKVLGLETGADDYITKPFDRAELLARVQAVLRRNEAAKQQGRDELKDEMGRLRQEVLNNMTQELRIPISSLLNMLELTLKAKFDSPAEQKIYISRAMSHAYLVRNLIEDLLILHVIDQGNINTFRQPVDLVFDVREPVEQCFERHAEKKLALKLEIDPDVEINAPKIEFRQAMLHLVDNACKFAPDASQVKVRLAANGKGGCILTVQNESETISPVLREKVFERFYQISQGEAHQFKGLGVGLTIARAVARSLNGDVAIVDSESGCVFKMVIAPAPPDWC
jgi:two-component system, sensor histidine kinase and response regulator